MTAAQREIKAHLRGLNGKPKSRPVCGPSSSLNGEISEWLADILDSVNESEDTEEVISSEELLSYLDDLAKRIEIEENPRKKYASVLLMQKLSTLPLI